MNKSIRKNLPAFLIPFLCCYLIVILFLYLFNFYSAVIGDIVSEVAGAEMSIRSISLLPLKGVRLNDIEFTYGKTKVMTMESMILGFSFRDLLKRRLVLREVIVDRVNIKQLHAQQRLSSNILSYLHLGESYTKGGFGVVFNQASYCFSDVRISIPVSPGEEEKSIRINFCLDAKTYRILCNGDIAYGQARDIDSGAEERTVAKATFSFDLESVGIDVLVNHIKVSHGPYVLTGSGIVRDIHKESQCDIRLYMEPLGLTAIPVLKHMQPKSGELVIVGNVTGMLKAPVCRIEIFSPSTELLPDGESMIIDHISARLAYHVGENKLYINECSLILDKNMRVTTIGHIENIFSPFFDLRFELMPLQSSRISGMQDDTMLITAYGRFQDMKFLGKLSLICYPEKDKRYVIALKDFSLLKYDASQKGRAVRIHIPVIEVAEEIVDLSRQRNATAQSFVFNDSYALLRTIGKTLYVDNMVINGYGGSIVVQGEARFKQRKTDYLFTVVANSLGLENIRMTYPLYCELSGVINGHVKLQNKKGINVAGGIVASDFRLTQLSPLDKVADFIGIQSIKEINDAQIITDFDLSNDISTIKRFDLDAKDTRLRSSFTVNTDQWLEGNIALSLPRVVLEESKMFKTLLSIAREREDQLDFVVHLSGFMKSLRTELTESDFRDKLKERVSPRIQRYIEQEINKAIDSQ